MRTKIIVVGAAGRMGRRILALALESGRFDIVGAVEKQDHPDIGEDAGLVSGMQPINLRISPDFPAGADVTIDFSQPEATEESVDYCRRGGVGLVLGTTGLDDGQRKKIEAASEKVPIVCATNMSVGMNVLFNLAGRLADMLGEDYDIEIVEQHHRFKKDAPSGSAMTLAENICRATNRDFPDSLVYGRSGRDALRQKGTIGIHAVRAGDVTGIHSVMYSTLGEKVTISHTAHSRDTFVRGALRAAEWLIDRKPALYSMADVLGIR